MAENIVFQTLVIIDLVVIPFFLCAIATEISKLNKRK